MRVACCIVLFLKQKLWHNLTSHINRKFHACKRHPFEVIHRQTKGLLLIINTSKRSCKSLKYKHLSDKHYNSHQKIFSHSKDWWENSFYVITVISVVFLQILCFLYQLILISIGSQIPSKTKTKEIVPDYYCNLMIIFFVYLGIKAIRLYLLAKKALNQRVLNFQNVERQTNLETFLRRISRFICFHRLQSRNAKFVKT